MTTDRLTTAAVAALLGIAPATWRAYVSRGQAPPPDGHIDKRTPYWLASTIEKWRP
jgi:predicted DNA-binding transcriptional regulator AlpA